MPYLIVSTSSKQIHSLDYWRAGYYDEATLIHFGTPVNSESEKLVNVLKARPVSPFPKELCLHWVCNFEIGSVLDTIEANGYSLVCSHENDNRVTYTFKLTKSVAK